MSLRTRLAVLAAFALLALLVAFFVAWRLARATETFALRQADSSLHTATRELTRAVVAYPAGYQTIEEAAAPPDGPAAPHEKGPRERPLPPHVKTLFAAYTDPLARLTAITLHRFTETAGGFYRAGDGALVGLASPDAVKGNETVLDVMTSETVRALAMQASETGAPAARTIQSGSDRVMIVAYPVKVDAPEVTDVSSGPTGKSANPIAAAWAMQRLSNITGVSDQANLIALVLLILSVVAVSGLALVTVRDLRSGVSGIERGLTGLTNDLGSQITPPSAPELARISVAINQLAETLRINLARQSELERDLRRNEKLSALGRLVAGVAHEVRNPLAAIKLKVQMARRAQSAPEKLDSTFRVITEEVERLDALVRRLLEFGRTKPLAQSGLDLCELIQRRAALFNDVAEKAQVKIEMLGPAEVLMIEGDAERLAQVFDNLIQNALDAMPTGGQLTIICETVAAAEGKALARISVEDTGSGIPAADSERVFEPFFTSRETGTGLGLAIAREIVEAHGGRINFVSREGRGAFFQIELPQSAEPGGNGQFDHRQGGESGVEK